MWTLRCKQVSAAAVPWRFSVFEHAGNFLRLACLRLILLVRDKWPSVPPSIPWWTLNVSIGWIPQDEGSQAQKRYLKSDPWRQIWSNMLCGLRGSHPKKTLGMGKAKRRTPPFSAFGKKVCCFPAVRQVDVVLPSRSCSLHIIQSTRSSTMDGAHTDEKNRVNKVNEVSDPFSCFFSKPTA